jgi:signal transduction histidine kinase
MPPSTWSLSRRIYTLSALAAVILAAIALAATLAAAGNRADVHRVTDVIDPARSNSERMLASLYRQQSAIRTYAVTGVATDLQPYQDALTDERTTAAATRLLLAGEPALLASVDRVTAATDTYRREIGEPLIARTHAGGGDPKNATPTDQSRTLFRAASDAIGALSSELSNARDAARHQADQTSNLLLGLLIAAAAVVVVAGIGLALLLRRLVTRPVLDLAAEVRRVAAGDYEYTISSDGPPELRALALDVNGMREQIAHDLAEVRQARAQIEKQAEELTRSNRDLEQFAYVASHDLQEPLRKVASFCQLLQRRYAGRLDERADQYIGFAVDGAQRMQRLINDLLAFSRIGRLTNGFHEVDLNTVVVDAAAQFDGLRAQTGAEITFADLPVVLGEEPLLGALFGNLIGNAIKFRHPDRSPIVHIGVQQVGDEYEFSVEDNGIGIEPEFADKVFVIFQRLHAKETYPGTGIGLAIAKKIVEYHGGRIWIDTEHADGTLFRFTLPVQVPATEAPEAPEAPDMPETSAPLEETVA